MNKYSLLPAFIMLTALSNLSISNAQPLTVNGEAPNSKTTVTEPITLETATGMLYGTLERPQSRSRVPVVLIISGSGPTDRDGNSIALKGPNNSLKLLAEALATNGIASVRYDKRGVGETGKAMMWRRKELRRFCESKISVLTPLYMTPSDGAKSYETDPRFSSLPLLGHSEGSLVGMVAAQRLGAQAFVSIAGAGRPIIQVILEQVKTLVIT